MSTSAPETDPSQLPSALGPGRAFLVFLAFLVTQITVGFVIGVVCAIVYLVLSPGGSFPRLVRLVVMPAAIIGMLVGGLVSFVLTRWTLPGPIGSGALLPIGWRKASRSVFLLSALGGLVLSAFYLFGLAPLLGATRQNQLGPLSAAATSGGFPRHLWTVLVLLVAPPIEEFVFRGVMFSGFRRSWSAPLAATATVIFFMGMHLSEAHGAALISIGLLGYATVLARVAGQSLLAPIVLHAAYNLGITVAVYGGAA